ncbi:hypothetical protein M2323_003835 [Rhodoblastus acidophilus]|uniref:PepSY domain-containing protein n=1 Tax=Rhodoblastus acidophilus TaxID=1074 RepID=UPI00222474E7|nr:PepSY domain-containing protein [Rhodoblastus acidophilus]MCW2285998.1 hypothetical protein [Rhodoblastus acidophilus]MCW2334892.1 hypothetical protein [Rhodoblastus acidophilus]
MRVPLAAVLVVVAGLDVAGFRVALADTWCSAPLSDWQPRETFQKKLEAEGWREIAIRVEDGCYLVHAANERGERLHGKFDPVTLAAMPHDHDRHHHHHHGDEDHE